MPQVLAMAHWPSYTALALARSAIALNITPMLPRKPAKCSVCRLEFHSYSMTHKVCGSVECAIVHVERTKEKESRKAAKLERADIKVRKAALRTKKWYIDKVKKSCHAFIRARDLGRDCICCPGTPLGTGEIGGAYDAGHFRSVGSAKHLRFDIRNIHGQNKQCNSYGAGRALEMRKGLILRYGVEYVEAIESDQAPRHYTIDDLVALDLEFKRMLKELLETRG